MNEPDSEPRFAELVDVCYNRLSLHEAARQQPQFCICVIGLVGAGKSTTLRALSQDIPVVRHAGDEVRRLLKIRGLSMWTSDAITIGRMVSERLKQNGYNVAHDASLANPIVRSRFREHNESKGIREIWMRVEPPEDYIIDKLRTVAHNWLYDDAEHAIREYVRSKAIYHHDHRAIDGLPYTHVFDPSRSDLQEQAARAVQEISRTLPTLRLPGCGSASGAG